MLVDSRGPGPLRAAITCGSARVLDPSEARPFNERCCARYQTASGRTTPEVGGLLDAHDTICIEVRAHRWTRSDRGPVFKGKLEDRALVRACSS